MVQVDVSWHTVLESVFSAGSFISRNVLKLFVAFSSHYNELGVILWHVVFFLDNFPKNLKLVNIGDFNARIENKLSRYKILNTRVNYFSKLNLSYYNLKFWSCWCHGLPLNKIPCHFIHFKNSPISEEFKNISSHWSSHYNLHKNRDNFTHKLTASLIV